MSLATSNRDGGRTSESGHLRSLIKSLKAQVLTGLAVSQRGAGANMSVDVAIGDAVIPRSDGTYGHPAWADAIYNVAITTADVSNPRRDIVVMYIDYSVTPSTGVSNNTNGVVKIAVIPGTPAGSPSDPSNASIQSAVGASNPYIKLARVRVAAGASSITNSVIDDLRLMATGLLQGGWNYDDLYTWVYSSATAFTIAGVDARAQFPIGSKLALYQGGTLKYFTVTNTAFSTNTTVTIDGIGLYTLANLPIDKPAFSYVQNPSGFPLGLSHCPFKFYAERTTAYNYAAAALTKFPVATERWDTGNNYDPVTNFRFTVTQAGFYHFFGRTGTANAGSQRMIVMLYKNGAEIARGTDYTTVTPASIVGVDLQLAVGDYVELFYYCTNASAIEIGNGLQYFGGHLISNT